MPTSVGTAYMTVMADMSKFGSSASSQLQTGSSSLLSTAKSIGSTLGIALGATALVDFGKQAFDAFEEAQKSMALFENAARGTGINVDEFNKSLETMMYQIGVDDEALRDLATQLLNMGFKGTTEELDKTVLAIENISIATGKSASMVERLFVALSTGNVTSALMMGKRLLGLTAGQVKMFKELAAAGDLATVKTQLMTIALNKDQGAAAAAATQAEKLSVRWNEFLETAGAVVNTGLDAFLESIGGNITDPGITTVNKHLEEFILLLKNGVPAADALNKAETSLYQVPVASIQKRINEEYIKGNISATQYSDAQRALGKTQPQVAAALASVNKQIAEQKALQREAAKATDHYLGLQGGEFKKWKNDTVAALTDTLNALDGVDIQVKHAGQDFQKSFKTMIQSTEQYVKSAKKLADENFVPEELKQWLEDQGPQAVVGFTQLSKKQQQDDVKEWENHQDTVNKFGQTVSKMSSGYQGDMNKSSAATKGLTGDVNELDRTDASVNVTFKYATTGESALADFKSLGSGP